MPLTEVLREIQLLVRSRYGLVLLDAPSEDRTESLLRLLAVEQDLPLLTWSLTRGLNAVRSPSNIAHEVGRGGGSGVTRERTDQGAYGTKTLDGALDFVHSSDRAALYAFEGIEAFLGDPAIQAKLLDLARRFARTDSALILLGSNLELPPALLPHAALLRVPEPSAQEYRELLQRIHRDLNRTASYPVELTAAELERLIANLRGLSLLEAEKILTKVIIEDGKLGAADIERVMTAKRNVVEREGLLEYYPVEHTLADVAGLGSLKAWLAKRSRLFEQPEEARRFGLTFPKGVLLLGAPGVGKSLAAKAIAQAWRLPLLKMDTSALYNKYVGETERNFRRAMRTAERVAPVVLWIDEIEKAFADGGESDGGASRRALGNFLSWLQDRAGDVFVVATANDVKRVPPELLRKGRFDELFFLDLPDEVTREDIFRVHLARRGHDPTSLDLSRLASAAQQFSGAEIEAAVVSALYTAFGERAPLTEGVLLREVQATRPLAVTRAEELAALREWARERAVFAG